MKLICPSEYLFKGNYVHKQGSFRFNSTEGPCLEFMIILKVFFIPTPELMKAKILKDMDEKLRWSNPLVSGWGVKMTSLTLNLKPY